MGNKFSVVAFHGWIILSREGCIIIKYYSNKSANSKFHSGKPQETFTKYTQVKIAPFGGLVVIVVSTLCS